ncbi:MAG: outer membrane lipoprotein carrier protein LolA [Paracoccaceae bacterium]
MAATIMLLATGAPALAEKLPLVDISTYFNNMTTAVAEFTQINDDGSLSTGEIFIRRPGRIRFEYNPPDDSMVMAGKGQVAVFDAKSNQPPERFPLVRTPLYLILAKTVNLNRDKMVVGHAENGPSTSVLAQDPEHPEYGTIELVFTDKPLALRQWIVTDGSGQRTTVILGEFNLGGRLDNKLFDIDSEMETRGF